MTEQTVQIAGRSKSSPSAHAKARNVPLYSISPEGKGYKDIFKSVLFPLSFRKKSSTELLKSELFKVC